MEITGTTAYTSAAKIVKNDDEQEVVQETQTNQIFKEEKDNTEFSKTDYDKNDVKEKAQNYLQNILFTGNLTEESKAILENYLATFDVDKFIKMYGPFTSASEISAAMYAVTSGLIKYQEEE